MRIAIILLLAFGIAAMSPDEDLERGRRESTISCRDAAVVRTEIAGDRFFDRDVFTLSTELRALHNELNDDCSIRRGVAWTFVKPVPTIDRERRSTTGRPQEGILYAEA